MNNTNHKHNFRSIFETDILAGQPFSFPEEFKAFSRNDTAYGDEHVAIIKCKRLSCGQEFLVRKPLDEWKKEGYGK